MSLSLAFFVLNAVVYDVFIVVLVAICVNFAVSSLFFVVSVVVMVIVVNVKSLQMS